MPFHEGYTSFPSMWVFKLRGVVVKKIRNHRVQINKCFEGQHRQRTS